MSGSRLARVLGLVLTAVVLTASGTYMLVYLYRWEWSRALISGMFFLIALVMLAAAMVMARLRRIERRIEDLARRQAPAGTPRWVVADRSGADVDRTGGAGADVDRTGGAGADVDGAASVLGRANDEHAARHFDWLRQPPDRLGVFVPILVGAGAILSGVAYLVERLAGMVASATVDRSVAAALAPQLPLGPAEPLDEVAARLSSPRSMGRRGVVAVVVVAVAVLAALSLVIMGATQTRTEALDAAATTVLDVRIDRRDARVPVEELAETLWVQCHYRVPRSVEGGIRTTADPQAVELVLDAGMGPLVRRRLVGCLEDTTVERAVADVIGHTVMSDAEAAARGLDGVEQD